MENKFYQFNQLTETEAELNIYGELTEFRWMKSDVSTDSFNKELKSMKGDLTVNINSSGGSVSTGLAIFNMLKNYTKGTVTTKVKGFAASAASLIFLAGQKRIMPKASLMFIHNAQSYCGGDANAMKKAAEDLEKVTQPSIEIYKATSNLDEETIKQMMDDETWLTADECLDYGFATAVVEIKEEATPTQTLNASILNLVNAKKELNQTVESYKQQVNDLTQKLNETGRSKNSWDAFFEGGNKK